ncbi:hypothetical protein [Vogesella mureinivorans]|uniref:hypothetical protein n=1 Tax=Vogesella mureinivorans TaxID=657276 RepID=UPI0011CAEF7C|nr:hypothetical protein [Vogesella mureinivorans]
MNTLQRIMCGLLLVALAGCASMRSNKPTVTLSPNGSDIVYNGELDASAIAQVQTLYAQATVKPTRLVINSHGGSSRLGMALGDFIHDKQLDIRVDGVCMSSCANYVFPAARHKYLGERDALLWHGGALQPDWEALIKAKWKNKPAQQEQAREDIRQWAVNEQAFFERIGVSQLVTVCGQQPEWIKAYPQAPGFYYSPEDMQRFGIHDIQFIAHRWAPEETITYPRFFKASFCSAPPPPTDEILCGCKFSD